MLIRRVGFALCVGSLLCLGACAGRAGARPVDYEVPVEALPIARGGDAPEGGFTSGRPPVGSFEAAWWPELCGGARSPDDERGRRFVGAGDVASDSGRDVPTTPDDAAAIALQGETLYAIGASEFLSAIDVADPARPRTLWRRSLGGSAREAYVRGTALFVVHEFERPGYRDERRWRGRVTAFDVSDRQSPRELGRLEFVGDLVAARAEADRLYLVTGPSPASACKGGPRLGVWSIALDQRAGPRELGHVSFVSEKGACGPPIVASLTPTHAFVAVVEDGSYRSRTLLRAVALGGAEGGLTAGNELALEGRIDGAGQLGQRGNVLRAIARADDEALSLSALRLGRGATLSPSTPVVVKTPGLSGQGGEALYEGDVGYVTLSGRETETKRGAVFAFDFREPSAPQARGQTDVTFAPMRLARAGSLLVALGYRISPASSTVHAAFFGQGPTGTLSPVETLSFPGFLWEFDTTRGPGGTPIIAHPDQPLVALAYGGSSDCHRDEGGYRLIELGRERPIDRGWLPHGGPRRRALWHRGALLSTSDTSLRSFVPGPHAEPSAPPARAEPSAPPATPARAEPGVPLATPARAELRLAASADKLAMAGDKLVRLRVSPGMTSLWLEVQRAGAPEAPAPAGSLELTAIAEANGEVCRTHRFEGAELFADRNTVYVVWPSDERPPRADATLGARKWPWFTYAVAVDVSDPTHPAALGSVRVPLEGFASALGDNLLQPEARDAWLVGSSVVLFTSKSPPCALPSYYLTTIDFADPKAPRVGAPFAVGRGAWGTHPLVTKDGSTLLMSHAEPAFSQQRNVRFWLDRVDLRTPSSPRLLHRVSVPGSLLAEANGRLVTVSYGSRGPSELKPTYALHLVELAGDRARELGSVAVPEGARPLAGMAQTGVDRFYLPLATSAQGEEKQKSLLSLAGLRGGPLRAFVYELDAPGPFRRHGFELLGVDADRALVASLPDFGEPYPLFAMLDAAAPAPARLVERGVLRGKARQVLSSASQLAFALGKRGVQTFARPR